MPPATIPSRRHLLALGAATLALGACGRQRAAGTAGPAEEAAEETARSTSRFSRSRLNPRNWFSRSREEERPDLGPVSDVEDNRPLVAVITELSIDRTSTGAIVRAVGQTPSAGWWDVELLAENAGRPVDGVLTYRMVAAAPREVVGAQTEAARTVVAAAAIAFTTLEQVGSVVVVGESNSRRSRR